MHQDDRKHDSYIYVVDCKRWPQTIPFPYMHASLQGD